MDEGSEVNQSNPWLVEIIPNENFVYRQSIPRDWIKEEGTKRRWPNEASFSLRKNETGLSVNWDKYISVKDNYVIIGLTQSTAGKYLNHTSFRIFKFPVEFLRSIEEISDVIHDPLFNGNPSPVGQPNNRAHSLIEYSDNDGFARMNLSDYSNNNYDQCFCEFNVNSINQELEELKGRLDNTAFHRIRKDADEGAIEVK